MSSLLSQSDPIKIPFEGYDGKPRVNELERLAVPLVGYKFTPLLVVLGDLNHIGFTLLGSETKAERHLLNFCD